MTPIGPTPIKPPEDRPKRTSRRIKVTLPESLAQKLDKLANRAGEPPAKIAGHMIRQAVSEAEADESAHRERADDHTRHDDTQPPKRNGRPPWLEPYGRSREWRGLMWAAIVGLHTRYPDAFSLLKEGWWRNATHLETLSALAVWRQWIDDAGGDPREELAFQAQLANYGHTLRQAGGSITRAWQPGAPPVEWS
jgi:hypothetical protein